MATCEDPWPDDQWGCGAPTEAPGVRRRACVFLVGQDRMDRDDRRERQIQDDQVAAAQISP